MPMNYYVSAKKSTVVSRSEVGHFTSPDELNLVVDRSNRIEIQRVAPEGLKNVCEVPVYGRITAMALFRAKNEDVDSIIVITDKHHLAILGYKDDKVYTRVAANVADRVGRESDFGVTLAVHPSGLIGVRLYEGTLKLIQWEPGADLRHFNVRFECTRVIDFKFIDTGNADLYRIAYINEDSQGRHLRIVDLSIEDRELKQFTKQENIANDSTFIMPVPYPASGVVVLGMDTVIYKPNDIASPVVPVSSPLVSRTAFTSFAKVDKTGDRYLLTDDHGRLLMLLINIQKNAKGAHVVQEMRVEFLGETSIADTINYLDNGVIFVGSRLGDSQLIRLTTTPLTDGSFVEVLETYQNIGPIRDMIHVDCDGQSQLVTCSGAFKEGTLRVVRNGIGIEELATVEISDVSGLFPLRLKSEFDNYMVVSLTEDTHVLEINGEELEDVKILEIDTDRPTMYASNLFDAKNSEVVLQITEKEVRLMMDGSKTQTWQPANDQIIEKVAVNPVHGQVVIASRDSLSYLRCSYNEGNGLKVELKGTVALKEEVACIDLSNEGDDPNSEATFVAYAHWNTFSLEVAKLPDLLPVLQTFLPTNILPRSVVATCIEEIHYLLVALGDGTLLYYNYDVKTSTLGEVKKTSVGTRPPSLHRVRSKHRQHLFVCSDRPVIIFSFNKKLVFSNVNVKQVHTVCSLQSNSYRDCLVLSDGTSMVFGTVDDIQKIHVRTIPMGESVRRIAYQKSSGTYCILSSRDEDSIRPERPLSASRYAINTTNSKPKIPAQRNDVGETTATGTIMIADQNTFQVYHSHELGQFEMPTSVITAQLADDPKHYYVVGTANIYPEEPESKQGRILVFEVDTLEKTKLRKVHEKDIKGCPYSMSVLNGKLLVAINSSVRLFEWSIDKELRIECSYFNNILANSIKTMGDHILVGDMMRSMGVLTYKTMEGTFEEVAKDWNCVWMTASEFITAERALGAESKMNLFTCEVDKSKNTSDDGRYLFEPSGFFYIGECVNVMRKCTLVTQPTDSTIQYSQPIMFGTVDGSIGMVVQIDDKWKKFLIAVEKAVGEAIPNCLQIEHSVYRQFVLQRRIEPAAGFIDGDLIESILDIDRSTALSILENTVEAAVEAGLPRDTSEILKVIEDLARIH